LTVRNCTVAGNSAEDAPQTFVGGIWGGYNVAMQNTVVAKNTSGKFADVYMTLTSSGYNLVGDSSGGSGFGPTDLLDIDPQLGPLQDNGGQSGTMALLPGSPGIDSGNNLNAPEWDQRGPGYPRIVNGTIDRGAFEVQSTAGPAAVPSVLTTAPIPPPAVGSVPQPTPAAPESLRTSAVHAPEQLPIAARQAAPSVVRAVPVAPAPDLDAADPLALDWR
jgi:hypothetical protein